MNLFIRGKTKDDTDALLIEKYRQTGDTFFVGELFKRYSHQVYGMCLSYFKDKDVSKDAVMQVFEKLFDVLKTKEVRHFPSWLAVVTRNYCLDKLRYEKSQALHERDSATDTTEEPDPLIRQEEEEVAKAKLSDLERILPELKEEHQTCIRLFYFEEKSYKEIGLMTGFTEKKVKSCIQNGKRNLKILLSEQNEHIPVR
jgi:RNA polymerase sigma factor (sigma-70 family)